MSNGTYSVADCIVYGGHCKMTTKRIGGILPPTDGRMLPLHAANWDAANLATVRRHKES